MKPLTWLTLEELTGVNNNKPTKSWTLFFNFIQSVPPFVEASFVAIDQMLSVKRLEGDRYILYNRRLRCKTCYTPQRNLKPEFDWRLKCNDPWHREMEIE